MKLTKTIKHEILKNALDKMGLDKEVEAHKEARKKAAMDILHIQCGGKERYDDWVESLKTFHQSMKKRFPEFTSEFDASPLAQNLLQNEVYVQSNKLKYGRYEIEFSGGILSRGRCGWALERLYPGACDETRVLVPGNVFVNMQDASIDIAVKTQRAQIDIVEKVLKAESKIQAALDSCNTAEQLLKVWPEAEELLPAKKDPKSKLPAIPTADLNSMIGLPSDKKV